MKSSSELIMHYADPSEQWTFFPEFVTCFVSATFFMGNAAPRYRDELRHGNI